MEKKGKEKKYLDIYYINNTPILNEFYDGEQIGPEAGYMTPQQIGREAGHMTTQQMGPEAGFMVSPCNMDSELKGCKFGDEHFLFEGAEGKPKYENVCEVWEQFILWIEKIQRQMSEENKEESYEYWIGSQLIEFAAKRNAHNMYMLMKRNWEEFRDTYLGKEECPEIIMEFVQGIMHKKMTQKQMWGSEEDRMPEGRVVIFDQSLMPKEGEDTGKLKFEYRPNYREEMLHPKDTGK